MLPFKKKGEEEPKDDKLSVFGAFSAYLSCIMGAGIVSLPFSFVNVGPLASVIIHATIIFLIIYCVFLLLKSKDHLGYEYYLSFVNCFRSYSEIAFVCFGKTSVYIINLVIAFCIYGICILFMSKSIVVD